MNTVPVPSDDENAPALTLPLDSPKAELSVVGGKGASLARLATAGLPVPGGFHVTTVAYRRFVRDAELRSLIDAAVLELAGAASGRPDGASKSIRDAFERATLPVGIREAIVAAYAGLPEEAPAVAVRSSATAEDLPEHSFAGQQETYLNVRGEAALLEAVQRCWSSLWTPRAIAYRQRAGIDHAAVAMAVTVQRMAPAEVAGVLFTANPTTGVRDELLVNASYGLGEAIVSGQVTPDSVRLRRGDLELLELTLGTKEARIDPAAEQGVSRKAVPADQRISPALTEPQLRELAALALEVEALFGGLPLDIEWAWAQERFALLQARPITSLPEVGDIDVVWEPDIPESAWIRRQVVEHMPEPLSPLFAELYVERGLERSIDVLLAFMGIDPGFISDLVGRPFFDTVNGFAYMRADFKMSVRNYARIMKFYGTAVPRLLRTAIPYWRDDQLPAYVAKIERWKRADLGATSDERLIEGVGELAEADAVYWFAANFPLALSKVTDGLLQRVLRGVKPGRPAIGAQPNTAPLTSGPFLRGYPSKTLDAQVALEDVAGLISADSLLRSRVLGGPAGDLVDALGEEPSGGQALAAVESYLEEYGHQIYNLDFAVPTLAEDPMPVLVGLHGLVAHPERDARARQARFVAERERLADETLRRLGPIRRPLFRKVLAWAQRFTPYREDALYYVGAAWPTLRRMALELGGRFVAAGTLDAPDDVFFLRSHELREAADARTEGEPRDDLGRVARERRALRESRKRLLPPPTVPPDYRWKVGPFDLSSSFLPKVNVAEGDVLEGFAVSPGRVTAPASVILSPADFEKMRPDTILVCPTTTPAWTPLFAQARGLVTDIGGVLAHGSIVAREYGIPAVMGTTVATKRVRDGQVLTLDGVAGTVAIHEG